MKDLNQILKEIRYGNLDNDDLNRIIEAVKFARTQLVHDIKRELRPGDTVYFTARSGTRVRATVESVKIKNAVVNTGLTRYRVPCNMLSLQG